MNANQESGFESMVKAAYSQLDFLGTKPESIRVYSRPNDF